MDRRAYRSPRRGERVHYIAGSTERGTARQDYVCDGPGGKESLAELFGPCSQLAVYHFMVGPDWEQGCPSCSFWADPFNGVTIHLRHRDIQLVAISRAAWEKLEAYGKRLGWQFKWVSSLNNDFNHDYQVSFTPELRKAGGFTYNFTAHGFPSSEGPGISVFSRMSKARSFALIRVIHADQTC